MNDPGGELFDQLTRQMKQRDAAAARTAARPSKSPHVQAIDPLTRMNKTETRYAAHLAGLLTAGEILHWEFEPIKLRLADRTFYTPDFLVIVAADRSLELHDVKGRSGSGPGGWTDDARVKIKVAASNFPYFRFVGVAPIRSNGDWKREVFKSC